MIKKIIFSIIALVILVFGIHSFNRLRYWDRSVQIFKLNSNQSFNRGFNRGGRGSFNANFNQENRGEKTIRPDFSNIPDSVRQRFTNRQLPFPQDSLRPSRFGSIPTDRNSFRGRGGFEGGNRQRGGFSRRNIRLNTVYRFLAVFSAFTIATLYIDKIFKLRRKKKKMQILEVKK